MAIGILITIIYQHGVLVKSKGMIIITKTCRELEKKCNTSDISDSLSPNTKLNKINLVQTTWNVELNQ